MIGGGEIAERKIKFLLRAQAQVQVVAETLSPALADLAARRALSWRATEFSDSLVDDVFLVIAATEDEALNQRVFAAANARYRLVNVVDNQALVLVCFPFYRRPFRRCWWRSPPAVKRRCCRAFCVKKSSAAAGRISVGWRNQQATGATI